ncbi:MAG: pilus assembly protein [Candidatus Dadabacteria bacterium]|nr:MAG: pilus assembly protein [Candidatus Dadabacteria bacterium]
MKKITKDNLGAVLVEFALTAIIYFTVVFFLIDAAFFLHRYLRLIHATREVSRYLSTELGEWADMQSSPANCNDTSTINDLLNSAISSVPADTSSFNFSATTSSSSTTLPLLTVTGTWQGICFICTFFGNIGQVSVVNIVPIETANCT